ncbi:MAG: transcription antitermination factor NusB, partial [Kordiimonadaceae bacterium]|nr:transcription antitermination factor NusB [Kordiimonadaceae bacterium]
KGWSLGRLEAIIRAIFRAGAYELSARPDVPTAVIINEYLDVAHAFYDRTETAFVNGVLDKLAKSIR